MRPIEVLAFIAQTLAMPLLWWLCGEMPWGWKLTLCAAVFLLWRPIWNLAMLPVSMARSLFQWFSMTKEERAEAAFLAEMHGRLSKMGSPSRERPWWKP